MRAISLWAVVGRIVKFPKSLHFDVWAGSAQKRVVGGQKRCNITWDYVA